jgi:hypothetical protein
MSVGFNNFLGVAFSLSSYQRSYELEDDIHGTFTGTDMNISVLKVLFKKMNAFSKC